MSERKPLKSSETPISVSVDFEEREYVRYESIPLSVSIENKGSLPVKIDEFTVSSETLQVRMIDDSGERYSGSPLSWLAREGILVPPKKRKSFFLSSGQKKSISIDLIKIFGELKEGTYRVRVTYHSGGVLFVDSKVFKVKVVSAGPVYSFTPRDLFQLNAPIRTVWVNYENNSFYLFILENSPNMPKNIWSCRRIMELESRQEPQLSLLESYDQRYEHVIWYSQKSVTILTILRTQKSEFKKFTSYLPFHKIIGPPFTIEDGTLFLLIVSKDDKWGSASLFTLSPDGRAKLTKFLSFKGMLVECSVLFKRRRAYIVYMLEKEPVIHYLELDLNNYEVCTTRSITLESIKTPYTGLTLYYACRDKEGERMLCAHIMTEEVGKYCSQVIDVGRCRNVFNLFFPSAERMNLKLLDLTLDPECMPHYLFQDQWGALWYQSPKEIGLQKVTADDEICPGNVVSPTLIISSPSSRHYGVYLRYIKDRSHFIYKDVEKL
ncbi:MAG: hypothetical protein QXJ17_05595 [Nitrososphaeria archaeon]